MTIWTKRRTSNVLAGTTTWATADRPTDLSDGLTGYNTDYQGLETYIESIGKWFVMSGIWEVATRPATASLAPGSQGYNSELNQIESWDGSSWLSLG